MVWAWRNSEPVRNVETVSHPRVRRASTMRRVWRGRTSTSTSLLIRPGT